MPDRLIGILAEERAQPANPFTPDDVVGVNHAGDLRDRRDVPAHHDRRRRGVLAHEAAHLAHLADVHDDGRDADDVVLVLGNLSNETLARGKVENGARRGDVVLKEGQRPGAMEHAQGERPLLARHLVVIELDRVDFARSEFVVDGERFEDGGQENARAGALRVCVHSCMIEGRGPRNAG